MALTTRGCCCEASLTMTDTLVIRPVRVFPTGYMYFPSSIYCMQSHGVDNKQCMSILNSTIDFLGASDLVLFSKAKHVPVEAARSSNILQLENHASKRAINERAYFSELI